MNNFYNAMRQIYVGSSNVINKASITYSKSFVDSNNLNRQIYLLFVRDDIFSER